MTVLRLARRRAILSFAVVASIAATLGVPTPSAVAASSIRVDTGDDALAVDGRCSLREAVLAANAGTNVDTCRAHQGFNVIELDRGHYVLSIEGRHEDAGQTGDLDVTGQLTILGAGAWATIVDAQGIDRAINVQAGGHLRLIGLKVTGGRTQTSCCGGPQDVGGAIWSVGSLALVDAVISDSASSAAGGGIASDGPLTLRRTTVRGNTGFEGAGGIAATGPTDIRDSRIVGNQSNGESGAKPHRDDPGVAAGIDSRQPLTLIRSLVARNVGHGEWTHGGVTMRGGTISESTIRENSASDCGSGGVVMLWGLLDRSTVSGNHAGACDGAGGVVAIDSQIWNSTISGNTAGTEWGMPPGSMQVGGVLADVATIVGSTITRNLNQATVGEGTGPGGLLAIHLSPPASDGNLAAIRDTILSGNKDSAGSASDCEGALTSDGHNLLGSTIGCEFASRSNDKVGVRPLLGPLADNGGATRTHLPLPGSPAIDGWWVAGPGTDADCPQTDQRGVIRPTDGDGNGEPGCDIGAAEVVRP